MITREQSDKILEQIIQRNENEVFKPLKQLIKSASEIIDPDLYNRTINRKDTWHYDDKVVELKDYGFRISFDNRCSLRVIICHYKNSVREEQKTANVYSYYIDSSTDKIFDALWDYLRSKSDTGYISWTATANDEKEKEKYRNSFNEEINGAKVGTILSGIKDYFLFAEDFIEELREKIEELSREVTKAYNNAIEREAQDDAMVLKEFGLTPDAVEPESFEVKIEVVKVNRGKKSTKKGKK